jgi:hypothetical protein
MKLVQADRKHRLLLPSGSNVRLVWAAVVADRVDKEIGPN